MFGKSKTKTLALVTGSIAAVMTGAAHAQQGQQQEPPADERVGEIVITATGRQAVIQEVPIAVTAVTAETIQNAGITDVRNLQAVVPSYRVATGQSNSAGTSINIRGIGTGADNPGFESAVGVFIDGVYRSRSGVALSELPEVDRIEVLRGPQGTLFGRNTSAGAVSIVTAGPEFSNRTFGEVSIGNYDLLSGKAGITGPVSDTMALRLEGGGVTREGFIEDLNSGQSINNRDRYFVRGQMVWDITPDVSVRLIADANSTDEQCCTAVYGKVGPSAGAINLLAGLRGIQGIPVVDQNAFKGAFTPGRNYLEQVDDKGISGEVNWDLNGMNLTYVGSSRTWNVTRNQDIDFNGSDRAYRDGFKQSFVTNTHEVRLQGEAGPLNWLVGGFYLDETLELRDTIRFGVDGARYADALASGVAVPWTASPLMATNPCNTGPAANFTVAGGSTIYASLPGQTAASPTVFQQVVCAGAVAQLAGLVANGTITPATFAAQLPTVVAQGNGLGAAFAGALRASAPQAGQGQNTDFTTTDTESWALFTHNELELGEQLTWTLGLRYNSEEKLLKANLDAVSNGCGVLQNTALVAPGTSFNSIATGIANNPQTAALAQFFLFACNPVVNTVANGAYADKAKETAWSGTTSLRFQVSDDLMVYAGYSRGFKSGGYNMDRSAFNILPTTTVKPNIADWRFGSETVDALEAGWKWTIADGAGVINGAIFQQKVEGYQINAFTGFNFVNFNAPSVLSQGFEVDASLALNEFLTLTAGASYIDATFDQTFSIPRVAEQITAGTPIAGNSEWNVTGSATLRFPIGAGLAGLVYVDGRYASEYRTQTLGRDPTGFTDQDAFALFNARIGIGGEDGAWSAELFARNLTDENYKLGAFGVPEQTGSFAIYPGEPRTYGLTLRASF